MRRLTIWLVVLSVWGSYTSQACAGLISAGTTWTDGQVLTHSDLNSEFAILRNEINGSLNHANLAATISLADGDYLDLAAILHDDTALQGLRLPQIGASPSAPVSGEGQLGWDQTNNTLEIYNGTAWALPAGTVKIASFTRDLTAASGAVAYTGVGFAPRAVIFLGGLGGGNDLSLGMDDGTTTLNIADEADIAAGTYGLNTTFAISLVQGVGTSQTAKITTLGTDGFTLTWTKTGSPTGTATVFYVAF